ncbi:MAG: hypothetical protein JSS09_02460 [Verrucomicrobia bacterium]|nr:hypothetical protein [Verrucomicrobiota bacterium]
MSLDPGIRPEGQSTSETPAASGAAQTSGSEHTGTDAASVTALNTMLQQVSSAADAISYQEEVTDESTATEEGAQEQPTQGSQQESENQEAGKNSLASAAQMEEGQTQTFSETTTGAGSAADNSTFDTLQSGSNAALSKFTESTDQDSYVMALNAQTQDVDGILNSKNAADAAFSEGLTSASEAEKAAMIQGETGFASGAISVIGGGASALYARQTSGSEEIEQKEYKTTSAAITKNYGTKPNLTPGADGVRNSDGIVIKSPTYDPETSKNALSNAEYTNAISPPEGGYTYTTEDFNTYKAKSSTGAPSGLSSQTENAIQQDQNNDSTTHMNPVGPGTGFKYTSEQRQELIQTGKVSGDEDGTATNAIVEDLNKGGYSAELKSINEKAITGARTAQEGIAAKMQGQSVMRELINSLTQGSGQMVNAIGTMVSAPDSAAAKIADSQAQLNQFSLQAAQSVVSLAAQALSTAQSLVSAAQSLGQNAQVRN